MAWRSIAGRSDSGASSTGLGRGSGIDLLATATEWCGLDRGSGTGPATGATSSAAATGSGVMIAGTGSSRREPVVSATGAGATDATWTGAAADGAGAAGAAGATEAVGAAEGAGAGEGAGAVDVTRCVGSGLAGAMLAMDGGATARVASIGKFPVGADID